MCELEKKQQMAPVRFIIVAVRIIYRKQNLLLVLVSAVDKHQSKIPVILIEN